MKLTTNELPKLKDLEEFLEAHCYTLSNGVQIINKTKRILTYSTQIQKLNKCHICSKDHKTYTCDQLINLSPKDRYNLIKQKNLCLKCLNPGHSLGKCKFYTHY